MQDPLGDIGRHGDSKTNIFTNFTKKAMQGPSESIWVIQVDIGTLKLLIVEFFKGGNAGSQWDYLDESGRHRDFEELLDDIGEHGDY